MDSVAIGRRVKLRREQLDLTQQEMADELAKLTGSFSSSHLSRVEAGKAGGVTMVTLRALAEVLGVGYDWLYEGESAEFMDAVTRMGADPDMAKALISLSGWFEVADEHERDTVRKAIRSLAEMLNRRGTEVTESSSDSVVQITARNKRKRTG